MELPMPKRLPLRDDSMAYQELNNYQNALINAFSFLNTGNVRTEPAGPLKEIRQTISDSCIYAQNRGAHYLEMLHNPESSDDHIRDSYLLFKDATQKVIDQMNELATSEHTAPHGAAGTTFKFRYLGAEGQQVTEDVLVTANSQDIYKGLTDLRANVWQKQVQSDFNRLNDSIGNQYLPRNFQAGRAA
jgi:hypothetical protein